MHFPATGIYPGPKGHGDIQGERKRPQRYRRIYLHSSSPPSSPHLRSFAPPDASPSSFKLNNSAPATRQRDEYSRYGVRIVVARATKRRTGRRWVRAPRLQEAISQFSSLTLSSSLCYSPWRNRIFPGRRRAESVVGTASSAALYIDVSSKNFQNRFSRETSLPPSS